MMKCNNCGKRIEKRFEGFKYCDKECQENNKERKYRGLSDLANTTSNPIIKKRRQKLALGADNMTEYKSINELWEEIEEVCKFTKNPFKNKAEFDSYYWNNYQEVKELDGLDIVRKKKNRFANELIKIEDALIKRQEIMKNKQVFQQFKQVNCEYCGLKPIEEWKAFFANKRWLGITKGLCFSCAEQSDINPRFRHELLKTAGR